MIPLMGAVKIYFCRMPVNLHRSFDGLPGAVEENLKNLKCTISNTLQENGLEKLIERCYIIESFYFCAYIFKQLFTI